ncbi:MAG TPA: hypothetical protein VNW90_13320 [Acetobacteraceae bacterium]|jgi:hypothetical protein|nr:hypothetical protein [Acetobacteraceae bacterium]
MDSMVLFAAPPPDEPVRPSRPLDMGLVLGRRPKPAKRSVDSATASAIRAWLHTGSPLTDLEAMVVLGASGGSLTAEVTRRRHSGRKITTRMVSFAEALDRVNRLAIVVPPLSFNAERLTLVEYQMELTEAEKADAELHLTEPKDRYIATAAAEASSTKLSLLAQELEQTRKRLCEAEARIAELERHEKNL